MPQLPLIKTSLDFNNLFGFIGCLFGVKRNGKVVYAVIQLGRDRCSPFLEYFHHSLVRGQDVGRQPLESPLFGQPEKNVFSR